MPRDSATPEERERKNIDKETMACLMGKAVERKTSEGRRKKEEKKKGEGKINRLAWRCLCVPVIRCRHRLPASEWI